MTAHDDPTFAAARAFAELPVLAGDPPLPADAGLRTKLLERDLQRAADMRVLLSVTLGKAADELESLYGADHPSVREARRAITLARLTS